MNAAVNRIVAAAGEPKGTPVTIIVVGIGADGMAGLAPALPNCAQPQSFTVHPGRSTCSTTPSAPRHRWPSPMLPALEHLLDDNPHGDVHVVASGDPMLHGIGTSLIRLHGAHRVGCCRVSSVTLACARLGWAAQDTEVISLVTASVHTAVRRGGQAVVLSATRHTRRTGPAAHRDRPRRFGFTVLEQLGGPPNGSAAGRPTPGPPRRPPTSTTSTSSRCATCPTTGSPRPCPTTPSCTTARSPSRPFARSPSRRWRRGRATAVGRRLGSGSIAVEWCRADTGCRAVAFETSPQRCERITANSRAFGVEVDVRGEAPADFDGAPPPDAIFIGGGLTQPGLVSACIDRLGPGGRLVANAVTAESEALLVEWHTGSAANCAASSTTAVNRSAGSPAGGRRCRSPSGR
jgi:precorrin-6Y C5,15-methyltransferase (decarboxylating)